MRYIGSKILMLSNIKNVIDQNTENVQTIADVFRGQESCHDSLSKTDTPFTLTTVYICRTY